MRSTILLTILAIVALSLAEDTDQAKDTKSKEPGKESGKESGNDSGKESGNESGKESGNEPGKESGKEETYTDRFDNINVDEIVANRRLLVPYLKCALDKGRCTPEGKELKIHIQDAMQTACKKCTEKQKTGARQVVNHIKEKEPLYWEELLAKYDPKNELKPIYEPFLAGKDK